MYNIKPANYNITKSWLAFASNTKQNEKKIDEILADFFCHFKIGES